MNPTTNATTAASATRPIRRAVVTGGTGFLGSHLCTELRRREVEVVCLDNFLTGSAANIGHLVGDPGFRLVQCDVTDYVHVPGDVDLVLIDTAGRSPRDEVKIRELAAFLAEARPDEVHLVLSAVAGERSLRAAVERFEDHLTVTELAAAA